MKVVVNRCYGGFGLSEEAAERLGIEVSDNDRQFHQVSVYNDDFGITSDNTYAFRTDARLIALVEEMGEAASGKFAKLSVVDIPNDVAWEIEEYDGQEWVSEVHRTW